MTDFPTVEQIARAIYENHEEQCCTCGTWPRDVDDREAFLKPARAVLALLEGRP